LPKEHNNINLFDVDCKSKFIIYSIEQESFIHNIGKAVTKSIDKYTEKIQMLEFSSDGKLLFSSVNKNLISVYSKKSLSLVCKIQAKTNIQDIVSYHMKKDVYHIFAYNKKVAYSFYLNLNAITDENYTSKSEYTIINKNLLSLTQSQSTNSLLIVFGNIDVIGYKTVNYCNSKFLITENNLKIKTAVSVIPAENKDNDYMFVDSEILMEENQYYDLLTRLPVLLESKSVTNFKQITDLLASDNLESLSEYINSNNVL